MRKVEVGIIIKALDHLTAPARSMASGVRASFASIGKAAIAINQAMELAGKALRALERVGSALLSESGGYRRIAEGVTRTSEAFKVAADQSGALREASRRVREVLEQVTAYFRSDEGKAAVNGFFRAIVMGTADAIDAFVGLIKVSVDFSDEIKRRWAALRNEPFVEPLDAERKYGQIAVAAEQLAEKLRVAAQAGVAANRDAYTEIEIAAKKAADEQQRINKEKWDKIISDELKAQTHVLATQEAALNQHRSMEEFVAQQDMERRERIGDVRAKFEERYAADFDKSIAMRLSAISKFHNAWTKADELQSIAADVQTEYRRAIASGDVERAQALKEQLVQIADEQTQAQIEKIRPLVDFLSSTANSIGSAFMGIVDDIMDGTKSGGEMLASFGKTVARTVIGALINMGVQAALTALFDRTLTGDLTRSKVLANAAVAASAAIASAAALPFPANIPAMAAAGPAAYGAAAAFEAGIPLATGGLIRGGIPGRDSVPAMLMPDEYVIPAAQVRANIAAGRAPDDSGGAGGSALGLTVVAQSFVPQSRADFESMLQRALVPSLEHLARTGRLSFDTAGRRGG